MHVLSITWHVCLTTCQAGEETDFILVSCSGAGVPEDVRDKVVKAKMVSGCVGDWVVE